MPTVTDPTGTPSFGFTSSVPADPELGSQVTEAFRQVSESVSRWQRWCLAHARSIRRSYLLIDEQGIGAFASPLGDEYDYELTRLLSDLLIELTDAGIPARTGQVPFAPLEDLTPYFDPAKAFVYTP